VCADCNGVVGNLQVQREEKERKISGVFIDRTHRYYLVQLQFLTRTDLFSPMHAAPK
jgi:hypothetical protein